MNKNELIQQINCYKTKIPNRSNVVIHVYGKNLKNLRTHLNYPYDRIFNSLMEETMHVVAKKIDGCSYAFTIDNDFVFVLHNEDHQSPYMNNDVQKMVSIIASEVSVNFYRLFLAFNVEYEAKISEINENDKDAFIELETRLASLWNALSEIPVFYTEIFTLPDDDEFALIERLQDDNINRSIEQMSRLYMDQTEGLSHSVILKVLEKKGYSWYDMPHDYKFGIGYLKRNIDGKNIWTENIFMGERAERYSKK